MLGDAEKDFYKGRYVCINCIRAYYNNRYNEVIKPRKLAEDKK